MLYVKRRDKIRSAKIEKSLKTILDMVEIAK